MFGIMAQLRDSLRGDDVGEQSADLDTEATDIPDTPSNTYAVLGMSPEQLLRELIRSDGGWAWQQDLIATTEWSASTVSRYLSEMEAEGWIVREAVGRENVVGFPETLDASTRDVSS